MMFSELHSIWAMRLGATACILAGLALHVGQSFGQQPTQPVAAQEGTAAFNVPLLNDPDPTLACSGVSLEVALARSLRFKERAKKKNQTNLLPLENFKFSQGQLQTAYERTQTAVQILSKSRPTLSLIYGRVEGSHSCVWLLDGRTIVAKARIEAIDPAAMVAKSRNGLDVKVASRKRLDPRKRDENGECEAVNSTAVKPDTAVLSSASEKLLPPAIKDYLASHPIDRLVIVPTGPMRAIPFAALPLGRGVMIDRFALVVEPDASALYEVALPEEIKARNQRIDSPTTSLIVGAPDLAWDTEHCWETLPHALKEAQFTASLLDQKDILVGGAANYTAVQEILSRDQDKLGLIWFTTHGYADPVNPLFNSYLALSGKHLNAVAIRDLKLARRPLVVLSACESGLGKTFPDGIFGIEAAWRFAGASQVVTSLWDVSDEGTELLMAEFARNLKKNGMKGAEFALADAMRTVKKALPDPTIWAAFSLQGTPTIP